jgi:hypothetical protein
MKISARKKSVFSSDKFRSEIFSDDKQFDDEGFKYRMRSKHVADELIDVLLSVSPISSSLEGVSLVGESASGGSELEGPEEVVGGLEVGANGVDFVDQVLNTLDVVLAQSCLNDVVAGQGDSLLVDLAETSLVNELLDGLSGRVAESDVGFNLSDQV